VTVFCALGLVILIGILTYWGIHARAIAEAALEHEARETAIRSVDTVHPALGAASSEVVLPANV